jgi:hypothetical protein
MTRHKTAIDILNVAILLVKLEGEQFNWYKQKAWDRDNLLTEQSLELMEKVFKNVNVWEYWMNITLLGMMVTESDRVPVSKITSNSTEFIAMLPISMVQANVGQKHVKSNILHLFCCCPITKIFMPIPLNDA